MTVRRRLRRASARRPLVGLVGALAVSAAVLSPVSPQEANPSDLVGTTAAAALQTSIQPPGTNVVGETPVEAAATPVAWRSLNASHFRSRYAQLLPTRAAIPSIGIGAPTPVATLPTTGPGSAASFSVFRNSDGTPTRFDPCSPVSVRINAPSAGHELDAREAVRRLGLATGINFRIDGTTSFVPTRTARSTPGVDLVIAWAAPGSGGSDFLGNGQLGAGGWNTLGKSIGGKVHWRISTGFAVLDRTKDHTLAAGFGSGVTRGALLMHELAHAVGLDHFPDSLQLMNPVLQKRSTPVAWGAGDLAALRLVGLPSGCIPR